MEKINLNTPAYDAAFEAATIYAKKAIVAAVQVTAEALVNDRLRHLDVRKDEHLGYVVDTYVMVEEDGQRKARLENTHTISEGMWIVTNPLQKEGDAFNNFAMSDADFKKRYEPHDGRHYRARGMGRIIPNTTGHEVEIDAPWGGTQNGAADCYFCCAYDPANPDELGTNRYILSQNDFQAYAPAKEVLG